MNLFQDGSSDFGVDLSAADFEAILAGWKAQQIEETEPKHDDDLVDDEESVIDDATVLEGKFDAFKSQTGKPVETTLMVFDPIERVANDTMELAEDEFKWIIDRLRRRRRGEEDPQDHLERIAKTLFSMPDKAKEAQPQAT